LLKLAICPDGPSPYTLGRDVDYYRVETTAGALMAEVFYDITYGDLDVGIFDETGKLVAADGSAVSNGCVAATVQAGNFYVVVAGANNADANRYELRVSTFSTPHTCS
jgi:hypothetical protein